MPHSRSMIRTLATLALAGTLRQARSADWESEIYRRLVDEPPGDCQGTSWIVEGGE
jgi:hypothetical protein